MDICCWEDGGAPKNERRGCGKEGRRTKRRRDAGREVGRKEIGEEGLGTSRLPFTQSRSQTHAHTKRRTLAAPVGLEERFR